MNENTETKKRVCRRCLLRESDPKAYEEQLADFIRRLKPSERCIEADYETRLSLCKECESLVAGTCQKCGCYVEIRAAGKNGRCPAKKW